MGSSVIESRLSHCLGDPNKVYTHQDGLHGNYSSFKLQHLNGKLLTEEELKTAWKYATCFLDEEKEKFLGFQANLAVKYSERPELTHFLDTSLNNIGDPFANGSFNVNTKFFERPVLDYFASLWNAKWPHDKDHVERYWGFVLSMGGTEANLYGMWNGRDYLAGKVLLLETPKEARARTARGCGKASEPQYVYAECPERSLEGETVLCFFSRATHYSLKKAMVILNITTFYDEAKRYYPGECPCKPPASDVQWTEDESGWPSEVPTNEDGSIDVDMLQAFVKFFAEKIKSGTRKYSFLFCLNYGTVFKGSYDEVELAGKALIPIFQDCGLFERTLCYKNRDGVDQTCKRNGWWFHVDGALGAAYMPFLQLAREKGIEVPEDDPSRSYKFDFSLTIPVTDPNNPELKEYPLVHSISMSGHKWIGAPTPTGIFMTKVKYQLRPPEKDLINYIGSLDTTFAGSRSGLAAAYLWTYFSQRDYDSLIDKAIGTQKTAIYFYESLKELEKTKGIDLTISRAKLSLALVFKRPTKKIVLRYSLSKEEEVLLDKEGLPVFDPATNKPKINYVVHAYAMEHVTRKVIDELITDCSAEDAFCYDWAHETANFEEVICW